MSQPLVGAPLSPVQYSNGDPTLESRPQENWARIMQRDAEYRGLQTLPDDLVAPYWLLHSALLFIRNFPHDTYECKTMYNTNNLTLFAILAKISIEDLERHDPLLHKYGTLIFNISPRKRTKASDELPYNLSSVPPHFRDTSREICDACDARVAVLTGSVVHDAFLDIFAARVRLVAEKTITIRGQDWHAARVDFMFQSAADIANSEIKCIVFTLPHPESFNRLAAFEPGVNLSNAFGLAADRFLDAATWLAVGQVPRPVLLSSSSRYLLCLFQATFGGCCIGSSISIC